MSEWGWSPERSLGIWRHGAGWLRPLMASVPYVTVGLLLLMLFFLSGTLSSAPGVRFDLPAGAFSEVDDAGPAVLVMPSKGEIVLFFDQTRYPLNDAAAVRNFRDGLTEALRRSPQKTLTILADRRVETGELMTVMSAAKASGAARVLVAGRQEDGE